MEEWLTDCLATFDPAAAGAAYRPLPHFPPQAIYEAAITAAAEFGRALRQPYLRGPSEAQIGDRSFAWPLSGMPPLMVKVLGTPDRSVVRGWSKLAALITGLEPPRTLRTPRIHGAGQSPVPWVVEDAAQGAAASSATLDPQSTLDIVLTIQQVKVRPKVSLEQWGPNTYAQNIEGPLQELSKYAVITPAAVSRARDLARRHLREVRALTPVLVHNDLAIHHIYLGDEVPWVIDWESTHYDHLLLLDVAHLIINHGELQSSWARALAEGALHRFERDHQADLRSNLVVCLLERSVGKAYDALRRQQRQSRDAVESLCAVLEGEFVAVEV